MTDELTPEDDSPAGRIAAVSQENQLQLQRMSTEGIAPPDVLLLKLRLDVLWDFVVGSAMRLPAEAVYQQRLQQMLAEYESAARRARLTEGIQ
jgi:hypothetical protein